MSRKVTIPDIDDRARRTRNALSRALIELATDQPVDSITVRDLTVRAGIGRSTFYSHFSSIGDFLRSSYANMLARAAQVGGGEPGGDEKILAVQLILDHLNSTSRFRTAIEGSRERPAMLAAGEARLRRIADGNLRRLRPELPEARRRAAATFIAGGLMGLIRQWTESGRRGGPAELRAAFEEFSDSVLAGLSVDLDRPRPEREIS